MSLRCWWRQLICKHEWLGPVWVKWPPRLYVTCRKCFKQKDCIEVKV